MNPSEMEQSGRSHRRVIVGVLVFVGLNALVAFILLPLFGYQPTDETTWLKGTHEGLPRPSVYTPLPSLVARWWQAVFGEGALSAFAFHTFFFGAGLALVIGSVRRLFRSRAIVTATFWLTLLSPYLLWSTHIGRDVALDVFGVALVMFLATRIATGEGADLREWAALGLAAALATTLRESNLILLPALLAVMWLCDWGTPRGVLAAVVTFVLGLTPLLGYNYTHTGKLALSTRLGTNLYTGNHAYYLAGHPTFDIDGFLAERKARELAAKGVEGPDPVKRDAAFRQLALQEIQEDPLGAVYRMIVKSYWWVGLVRIPSSDVPATLDPERDLIRVPAAVAPGKDLGYVLHRALILLGILVYWKSPNFRPRRAALCLTPLAAMVPVVALTFPDTRFRLALDPYTYALAGAGLLVVVARARRKLGRVSTSDDGSGPPAQGDAVGFETGPGRT